MRLLREELKEIASDWNVHIISSSHYQGPCGGLTHLFFTTSLQQRKLRNRSGSRGNR